MSIKEDKGLGRFFLVLGIVMFITFSVSNFIGTSAAGFETAEVLNKQSFYLVSAAFAITLISFKLYSVFIKKEDRKYGNSIGFSNMGEFPHLSFFKRFTLFQISLLTFIILLLLATIKLFLPYQQQSFTGIAVLPQQFSPAESVVYSSILIPGAENLGLAVIIAALIVGLGFLARKYNWSKGTFVGLLIFLSFFISGLFGMGNHLLNPLYRDSEVALTTVFFFWGIGGILTAIVGFFVVFWLVHFVNNVAIDTLRFFSNDTLAIILILFIIGLSVLYFILYSGRLLGDSNRLNKNLI